MEQKEKQKKNIIREDPVWHPICSKVVHVSSSSHCRLFTHDDGTVSHQGIANLISD